MPRRRHPPPPPPLRLRLRQRRSKLRRRRRRRRRRGYRKSDETASAAESRSRRGSLRRRCSLPVGRSNARHANKFDRTHATAATMRTQAFAGPRACSSLTPVATLVHTPAWRSCPPVDAHCCFCQPVWQHVSMLRAAAACGDRRAHVQRTRFPSLLARVGANRNGRGGVTQSPAASRRDAPSPTATSE